MLLFLLADATYSTGHEFIIEIARASGRVSVTSTFALPVRTPLCVLVEYDTLRVRLVDDRGGIVVVVLTCLDRDWLGLDGLVHHLLLETLQHRYLG